ncbi:MAG: hypothetical protein IJ106_10695 [Parasporobacterium sp.]|nr:hypothetical protein [Parasporobacterium sp.]
MINDENIPKNKIIISMKELRDRGYSQYMVSKLVDEGKLIKLNKSYYENTGYQGEESDFYYVEAYAPRGVICLMSAAVYYNLTTFIPDAVEIAIPRKAKVSTIPKWPPMKVHYFTDERYALGLVTVQEGNNLFRIYDIEKTVVDIVFYRERVGIEEIKEILHNYLRRQNRELDRLYAYAKKLHCEKILRTYLEVLI